MTSRGTTNKEVESPSTSLRYAGATWRALADSYLGVLRAERVRDGGSSGGYSPISVPLARPLGNKPGFNKRAGVSARQVSRVMVGFCLGEIHLGHQPSASPMAPQIVSTPQSTPAPIPMVPMMALSVMSGGPREGLGAALPVAVVTSERKISDRTHPAAFVLGYDVVDGCGSRVRTNARHDQCQNHLVSAQMAEAALLLEQPAPNRALVLGPHMSAHRFHGEKSRREESARNLVKLNKPAVAVATFLPHCVPPAQLQQQAVAAINAVHAIAGREFQHGRTLGRSHVADSPHSTPAPIPRNAMSSPIMSGALRWLGERHPVGWAAAVFTGEQNPLLTVPNADADARVRVEQNLRPATSDLRRRADRLPAHAATK